MKKYLLPESGNFYKANLHCHTVLSDGCLTPEEVKKIYKNEGYSVVAYTDHDILIPHHAELSDDEFLALNGWEITFTEPEVDPIRNVKRVCHMCFIAKDPDNVKQVCWFHRKHFNKNEDKANCADEPEFKPEYTPESINECIARVKEAGFFVTYNHPTWSQEDYTRYTKYHGMDAMEICNFGCVAIGHPEQNDRVYDDMLLAGDRIGCLGTDDNHNKHPGEITWDSFGAWTCIKADKLDYKAITEAMANGNYYASQGPDFTEISYEDGKVTVKTSPVATIAFSTGSRHAGYFGNGDGTPITEATFELKETDNYVRVTIRDEKGKPAHSRAYFLDELK